MTISTITVAPDVVNMEVPQFNRHRQLVLPVPQTDSKNGVIVAAAILVYRKCDNLVSTGE